MSTELLYMRQGDLLEAPSTVEALLDTNTILLPATLFYPQGGGQPFDRGVIAGESGIFQVEQVRMVEGVVHHIGTLEGELKVGDTVACRVDAERRRKHSRIHSAGHLLDMAVKRAGYTWIPGKGYHLPEGPYVEYVGSFAELNLEETRSRIDAACAALIGENLPVRIAFMSREEMEQTLPFVPDYLPTDRPSRVVFMGEEGIPCGGTHVSRLGEIGGVTVRKMKASGGTLRVSYLVED